MQDKYKVYNLCSERLYDASLFEGKVCNFFSLELIRFFGKLATSTCLVKDLIFCAIHDMED